MKKQQLHEALAVLLTKLSSARDNPLLIDNYSVKALRTTLVTFKESGELHKDNGIDFKIGEVIGTSGVRRCS